MADREIAAARHEPDTVAALAELLIETVAAGGSVGFMRPLEPEVALAFWTGSLRSADAGERVVLVARSGHLLVATVTLILATQQNQPHRAEIAKLMTRAAHRGHGVARSLMGRAEQIAAERGRTLITLDTAQEDGAAGFYERIGYQPVGVIPDYALKPHGGLTGTVVYYKRLRAVDARGPG
jgi:ribosomal protein S18 acetylase RimI-like enzyme